jgi:hypothetical protein
LIAKSLLVRPHLEIPLLVEKLFDLLYHLLARSNIFLVIIEKQFNLLLFALYSYPNNQTNLDKLSQFLTCIDYMFSNEGWRENYKRTRMVAEEDVMERLMSVYISKESYVVADG